MLETEGLGLVIVDMQSICLNDIHREIRSSLVNAFCEFLDYTRELNMPTIIFEIKPFSFFSHGGSPTIQEVKDRINGNSKTYMKQWNDGFYEYYPEITPRQFFEERKVRNSLVIGVYSNRCVIETAIGARQKGFGSVGCKS